MHTPHITTIHVKVRQCAKCQIGPYIGPYSPRLTIICAQLFDIFILYCDHPSLICNIYKSPGAKHSNMYKLEYVETAKLPSLFPIQRLRLSSPTNSLTLSPFIWFCFHVFHLTLITLSTFIWFHCAHIIETPKPSYPSLDTTNPYTLSKFVLSSHPCQSIGIHAELSQMQPHYYNVQYFPHSWHANHHDSKTKWLSSWLAIILFTILTSV